MDYYKQRAQQDLKRPYQERKVRYIVGMFKNDEIAMMICSYLWTFDQAKRKIKEFNSKAKVTIDNRSEFSEQFGEMFVQLEYSKPAPAYDIEFDDFTDLQFFQYKDVHINEIDVYTNAKEGFLCGLEMHYLVDGDVYKYVLHHKTLRSGAAKSQFKSLHKVSSSGNFNSENGETPMGFATHKPVNTSYHKHSVYLKRQEYIVGVRVTGSKKYLNSIVFATNTGLKYDFGKRSADDLKCDFDLPGGDHKLISISGAL